MSLIQENEIRLGLVAHLDPSQLKNSETNALRGNEVNGVHFFLVVQVDHSARHVLAVPLFSEPGKDRVELQKDHKAGDSSNWIGEPSYFFKWQFWRIPFGDFCQASTTDTSPPDARRSYGLSNPQLLENIAALLSRCKEKFRTVSA